MDQDIYQLGFQAYQDGIDIEDCPYKAGTDEMDKWESGWINASDQDVD